MFKLIKFKEVKNFFLSTSAQGISTTFNIFFIIFLSRVSSIEYLSTYVLANTFLPFLKFSFFDIKNKIYSDKLYLNFYFIYIFPISILLILFLFFVLQDNKNLIFLILVILFKFTDICSNVYISIINTKFLYKKNIKYILTKLIIVYIPTLIILHINIYLCLLYLSILNFLFNIYEVFSLKLNFIYNFKKHIRYIYQHITEGLYIITKDISSNIIRFVVIFFYDDKTLGYFAPVFLIFTLFSNIYSIIGFYFYPNLRTNLPHINTLRKVAIIFLLLLITTILAALLVYFSDLTKFYYSIFLIPYIDEYKILIISIIIIFPFYFFKSFFHVVFHFFKIANFLIYLELIFICLIGISAIFLNNYYGFTLLYFSYLFSLIFINLIMLRFLKRYFVK